MQKPAKGVDSLLTFGKEAAKSSTKRDFRGVDGNNCAPISHSVDNSLCVNLMLYSRCSYTDKDKEQRVGLRYSTVAVTQVRILWHVFLCLFRAYFVCANNRRLCMCFWTISGEMRWSSCFQSRIQGLCGRGQSPSCLAQLGFFCRPWLGNFYLTRNCSRRLVLLP